MDTFILFHTGEIHVLAAAVDIGGIKTRMSYPLSEIGMPCPDVQPVAEDSVVYESEFITHVYDRVVAKATRLSPGHFLSYPEDSVVGDPELEKLAQSIMGVRLQRGNVWPLDYTVYESWVKHSGQVHPFLREHFSKVYPLIATSEKAREFSPVWFKVEPVKGKWVIPVTAEFSEALRFLSVKTVAEYDLLRSVIASGQFNDIPLEARKEVVHALDTAYSSVEIIRNAMVRSFEIAGHGLGHSDEERSLTAMSDLIQKLQTT